MRPSTSHGRTTMTSITNNKLSNSLDIRSSSRQQINDDDSWEADILSEINKPIINNRPITAPVHIYPHHIKNNTGANTSNAATKQDEHINNDNDDSISIEFDENDYNNQHNQSSSSIEIDVNEDVIPPCQQVTRPKTAVHTVKQSTILQRDSYTDQHSNHNNNNDISIEFSDDEIYNGQNTTNKLTENEPNCTRSKITTTNVTHTQTADVLSLDDSIADDIVDVPLQSIHQPDQDPIKHHRNQPSENELYSDDFDTVSKPNTHRNTLNNNHHVQYNKSATNDMIPTITTPGQSAHATDNITTGNVESIQAHLLAQPSVVNDSTHKHRSRKYRHRPSSSSSSDGGLPSNTTNESSTHSKHHRKHKHKHSMNPSHDRDKSHVNNFDTYYQTYLKLQQINQQQSNMSQSQYNVPAASQDTSTVPPYDSTHTQQSQQLKLQLQSIVSKLQHARVQLQYDIQQSSQLNTHTYNTLHHTQQLINTLPRSTITRQQAQQLAQMNILQTQQSSVTY